MPSGDFGEFKKVKDIRKKLHKFAYPHTHEHDSGETFRGYIQIMNKLETKGYETYDGFVVDEQIVTRSYLIEQQDGTFIIERKKFKEPTFARFIITDNGTLCLANSYMRSEAHKIISRALFGENDKVRTVVYDLKAIYAKYKGKWLIDISGRKGHWHGGTNYGDYMEDDDVIGKEMGLWDKQRVGFVSDYFSDRTKVLVTKTGFVWVYGSYRFEDFLDFVDNELGKFKIDYKE